MNRLTAFVAIVTAVCWLLVAGLMWVALFPVRVFARLIGA